MRLSAEVGLKTMERQMEDQRQKLHVIEINLAIEKQAVLNFKPELEKVKEVAQVARKPRRPQ